MKTKHLILPAICIAGALLLGSCKKKTEPAPNTSVIYHFNVDFNANTLNINKVDSVTVSLKIGDQVIIKKLQKVANTYSIDHVTLSNTPTGATVFVYTPKAINTKGFLAARTFVYDIAGIDTASALVGPSDVKKDKWKPRSVVTDAVSRVELTIGENLDDPYFSIKADNPTAWTSIQLLRDAFNGFTYLNGVSVYSPLFTNGSNTIINTTALVPYATSVQNQPWTAGEVLLNMGQPGNAYVVQLYYTYNSRN
jgi:hypothetical protein